MMLMMMKEGCLTTMNEMCEVVGTPHVRVRVTSSLYLILLVVIIGISAAFTGARLQRGALLGGAPRLVPLRLGRVNEDLTRA